MKKRVYIASPMSQGDRIGNFDIALRAFRELIERGYAPLCPQLTFLVEGLLNDVDHEGWLSIDLPWVAASDAVLRLPGTSRGADMETAHAEKVGVPVFGSVAKLDEWFRTKKENA